MNATKRLFVLENNSSIGPTEDFLCIDSYEVKCIYLSGLNRANICSPVNTEIPEGSYVSFDAVNNNFKAKVLTTTNINCYPSVYSHTLYNADTLRVLYTTTVALSNNFNIAGGVGGSYPDGPFNYQMSSTTISPTTITVPTTYNYKGVTYNTFKGGLLLSVTNPSFNFSDTSSGTLQNLRVYLQKDVGSGVYGTVANFYARGINLPAQVTAELSIGGSRPFYVVEQFNLGYPDNSFPTTTGNLNFKARYFYDKTNGYSTVHTITMYFTLNFELWYTIT